MLQKYTFFARKRGSIPDLFRNFMILAVLFLWMSSFSSEADGLVAAESS
jgi:hypothetical protein